MSAVAISREPGAENVIFFTQAQAEAESMAPEGKPAQWLF
jgi:hypothetical protein